MASTYTINLGLRKPEHRDPETVESWDAVLNNNFDIIDLYLGNKAYTHQYFIANTDSHSESLDKLDIALNAAVILIPTSDQRDALIGPPGHTPNAGNPYATIDYVRISRKEVLSPEYVNVVLAPTPGGSNTGNMTGNSEVVNSGGVDYRFNHYKWISSEVTLQKYDLVLQWQVPATFLGFNATPGKALILDIRTDSALPADCYVSVELHKDGTPIGTISSITNRTTPADAWASERLINEQVGFDSGDVVLASLSPGSILNVRITMGSKNSHVVKVGALTIQGTW